MVREEKMKKEHCAGTYYVEGYTRKDGTEVEGYYRTCGAAHNSATSENESHLLAGDIQNNQHVLGGDLYEPEQNSTETGNRTLLTGEVEKNVTSPQQHVLGGDLYEPEQNNTDNGNRTLLTGGVKKNVTTPQQHVLGGDLYEPKNLSAADKLYLHEEAIRKKWENRAELLYGNSMNKKKNEVREGQSLVLSSNKKLRELGLDDLQNNFIVEGNTISPRESLYKKIGVISYPKFLNPQFEELQNSYQELVADANKKQRWNNVSKDDWIDMITVSFGIDNIHIKRAREEAIKRFGKEVAENLYMSKRDSYMNTPYAKQHIIYNSYEEAPEVLKDYFKNKISEQIGSDKLPTTKGILIDSDKKSSIDLKQNLLENENFTNKIKKYNQALKQNYNINDSIALKGANWGNAVGNADIRDMHLNKTGDLELYIADVYDFNDGEKSVKVNLGRERQEKGEIIPYFYAYKVIITKDELKGINW